ncbi:beta-glucuronidase-like [Phymastichus coffea]|uniref:beta-glucuronidase-like n=1 Tax=Phymastichus coffea TaxID=108790 RepID=UPI00273BC12E|nr:beta-glucuronidase-like [Phymastichus coffea]
MFTFQWFFNVIGMVLEVVGLASVEPPLLALPGLLYPRESETREVKSLDGFWEFLVPAADDPQQGHARAWYAQELSKAGKTTQMPVPSSYNDITTSSELRDHVGPVWYERTFFAPAAWSDRRVFLWFGSVNYYAQVWLNGDYMASHEMGHLPFEIEVTSKVLYGGKNRLTVAVDNVLVQTSVPQGRIADVESDNGTIKVQTYSFDFFNYAGIHRPVLLHAKPNVYIEDITVTTEVINNIGLVNYKVDVAGLRSSENYSCDVNLVDNHGNRVAKSVLDGKEGVVKVHSPKLWWPRSLSDEPGYLYSLEIILSASNDVKDIYRLPFGIRSLKWTESSLLINDKPTYLYGFGRHEDSAIRGRGLDLPTVARDYELLKWIGANAYRTSHYPYSDEVLDLADRLGFLVIDECPSVDTENYSLALMRRHQDSLSELIRRDKNRPSVIMWSIANEPRTRYSEAGPYFKQIARHTKQVDPTRPITMAIATKPDDDYAGNYIDIISFNRYHAWYSNPGRIDTITKNVVTEAQKWHNKYNKPVIMTEYGADTIPGLHELPEYIWSEEYQIQIMSNHFKAFDQLREQGFFIGEFIWNFADFRTAQTYTRVGGNKKGVFTRDRQPKMVAHHIRRRYHSLTFNNGSERSLNNIANYISQNYHH